MRSTFRMSGPSRRAWRRALIRAAVGLALTDLAMRHPEAAYFGPVAAAVIELATTRPTP